MRGFEKRRPPIPPYPTPPHPSLPSPGRQREARGRGWVLFWGKGQAQLRRDPAGVSSGRGHTPGPRRSPAAAWRSRTPTLAETRPGPQSLEAGNGASVRSDLDRTMTEDRKGGRSWLLMPARTEEDPAPRPRRPILSSVGVSRETRGPSSSGQNGVSPSK